MTTRQTVLILLIVTAGLLTRAGAAAPEEKHPVYVGARVCASCHEGSASGHQYSTWLLSRHARAYASLALPTARPMAELSGIPVEPQESPICLGCHATGAQAEEWEKDPTFFIEDGVQCEKCHGPGSEYIDDKVMRDRDAAMKAGLRMPTKRDCMLCHYVKGSHVAIHKRPKLDIDEGWTRIAHPTPEGAVAGSIPAPAGGAASGPGPRFTGVMACARCHGGATMGHQFSRWRLSAHSRAYAVLATPRAVEIGCRDGSPCDPQANPGCLTCHTSADRAAEAGALDTFSIDEGVGCEACHGPGSEYSLEAVMRDPRAASAAGLEPVTRETCLRCHAKAHGKVFDYDTALRAIEHPTRPRAAAGDSGSNPAHGAGYKTPLNLAISPDGREIYVACEASGTVIVVDTKARAKVGEIKVGGQPADVTFSPDGRTAFVSNRLDDNVSVLDTMTRQAVRTIPVGDEPHGLLTDRSGKRLFVLNTAADSISVIDTSNWAEIRRLSASRSPWSLALSPDGSRIYVTNTLSRFVPVRTSSISEVTVLDAEAAVVEDRFVIPDANLVQGVAWHPSGEFALVTLNRTKNLVPMTRLLQGWTITNGIGVVWQDGRVDQVLLDEPNMHFADAADVAFTPDGRHALVTSAGTDRVAVVDVERLIALLGQATPREREHVLPNHLGKPTEFVVKMIPVKNCPKGILVAPDGATAWLVNSLDDSLEVIDLARMEPAARVDLGGPKEITKVRFGEILFHSAEITFQRQFSCSSCHPDGHVDGLAYDIEADGIGVDPVDNRTLRGILDTDPFKWVGTNPSLARQCGARLAVFFTRVEPFDPNELSAVDNYICTIPRPPNRYRPLGAELTEAQRRGKAVYERTMTNDGRVIPVENRCVTCHSAPMYTDRTRRNVGTKMWLDVHDTFDVPHLNNIYDSAPYLHNGASETLEEIWTRFNPEDRHGVTNDMTKDQLNDLIEYLKTL